MTATSGALSPELAAAGNLAERIAAEVATCAGVARLSPGPAATYLPYRVVPGVVIHPDAVSISIAAWYGRSLPQVADEVRAAARRVAPNHRIDVIIEDVTAEGG